MARLASWLFVPGADERFMVKVAEVRPDVAVLDLEDGIAPEELSKARARVAAATAGNGATPLAVRAHPVNSDEFSRDLRACGPGVRFLLLPKVDSPAEVVAAGEALASRRIQNVMLIPMIESANGIIRAKDILTAHEAVGGVALGAEDLAADLGLPPLFPGRPKEILAGRRETLSAARGALVVAAAAARVSLRVDSPCLALMDAAATHSEAVAARAAGFTGKFALHPAQVPAITDAFRPSREEIEWARTVVGKAGRGAQRTEGDMVDEAVVRQARLLLAAAEDPPLA